MNKEIKDFNKYLNKFNDHSLLINVNKRKHMTFMTDKDNSVLSFSSSLLSNLARCDAPQLKS